MTRPDAADAETRRLAELQRLAQARRLMEEAAASLPPGNPLRLAIERGLAEEAAENGEDGYI
jgi:hypothetical protein